MWNVKCEVFVMAFFCGYVGFMCQAVIGGEETQEKRPTALELLDRYGQTRDKMQSFSHRIEYKAKVGFVPSGKEELWEGVYFGEQTVRFDGGRTSCARTMWGQPRPGPYVTKDAPMYGCDLWDGQNLYQYSGKFDAATEGTLWIKPLEFEETEVKRAAERRMLREHSGWYRFLAGYFYRQPERIDVVLSKAKVISVRDTMDKIGGSDCYVIEATIKDSKYKLWIDPNHGYNIARLEANRGPVDLPGFKSYSLCIENMRFNEVDGVWLPVEMDAGSRFVRRNGNLDKGDYHIKVTEVLINPDHDILGSFVLTHIADGALVLIVGAAGEYTWKDGHVVDGLGRKVDIEAVVPKKPKPLVGKQLPRLKELGFKLKADQTRDKVMLICFFDMNQRPSRHTVLELAKRADSLKEKGVVVVCVQASKVDRDKVDAWVVENAIPFEVGMIEGDEEQTKFNWGVKSLPWLILTDRKQVVTAEGFGIEELYGKIQDQASSSNR